MNTTTKLICVIFFSLCISISLIAQPEKKAGSFHYQREKAKIQSIRLRLHEEKTWLRLVHYKKTLLGGYKSKADGIYFFISPDGKNDPEKELLATIHAFFEPDASPPQDWLFPEYHPRCRFPARFAWIAEKLKLNTREMPAVKCEKFDRWLADLNPESATLVFASFFMNNPASMFGHTLLRINKKRGNVKADLLDYGVNYAANPTTENAFLYTFYGLTGGFPGTFSMLPYYFKVNEYSDMESRDLWEYDLSLNREEVIFMSKHLWEMGFTHFDYFYFDENCSYQLLSVLETARPGLDLTDQFFYVVQPADTVKVIDQVKGLIQKTYFRPSVMSKYLQKYEKLDTLQAEFKEMVKKRKMPNENHTPEKKALLVDAVIDWLSFRKDYDKSAWPAEDKQFYSSLLAYRSQLAYDTPPEKENLPENLNPILAQETSQLIPSGGFSSLGYFMSLNFRSALRDLNDSPLGITPFSQIIIIGGAVRIYPEAERMIVLENFTFVDIVSLSPLQNYIYSPSYRVFVGITSRALEYSRNENFDKSSLVAEPGIGLSLFSGSLKRHIIPFSFINTRFETSPIFDYGYRWGIVSQTGLVYRQSYASSLKAEFMYRYFFLPDEKFMPITTITYNYTFTRSIAIEASTLYYLNEQNYEAIISMKLYL